jgi:hypothetical protein
MLLSLRQHDDESLKDFIMRFNQAKLSVESPTDEMVYASLYRVIQADGPLMAELARCQPETMLEFMNKVEEFINQDYNFTPLNTRFSSMSATNVAQISESEHPIIITHERYPGLNATVHAGTSEKIPH